MADQQAASGGNYSGKNKIPSVNELLQRLDKDKAERDRKIDEERKQREEQQKQQQGGKHHYFGSGGNDNSDVIEHQDQSQKPKEGQKVVRDPVTGK
ncbi:hypothetical protein KC343_g7305, partial [Hortaea werneckii]